MPGIVSGAFIPFTDAKDKRFTLQVIFCITVAKIMKRFQIYVENVSPFSLYASNKLFSSHSPSIRDFSCTLHKVQELRRLFVDAI